MEPVVVKCRASAGTGDDLEHARRAAFASGLRLAYVIAGSAAVVTALVVVRLVRARRTSTNDTQRGIDTWASSTDARH